MRLFILGLSSVRCVCLEESSAIYPEVELCSGKKTISGAWNAGTFTKTASALADPRAAQSECTLLWIGVGTDEPADACRLRQTDNSLGEAYLKHALYEKRQRESLQMQEQLLNRAESST